MRKSFFTLSVCLFCSLCVSPYITAQIDPVYLDGGSASAEAFEKREEAQRQYWEKQKQEQQAAENIATAKKYAKYLAYFGIIAGIGYYIYSKSQESNKRGSLDIAIKLIREGADNAYISKMSNLSSLEIDELRNQTSNNPNA